MWIKDYNKTDRQKELIAMSSEKFDEYMCEQYADIFRQRNLPMTETCMCWGFEIGPGWYPLLDELCDRIKAITDKFAVQVEFVQIKEKLGGGRFYHRAIITETDENSNEYKLASVACEIIDELISQAESMSYHICAATGQYYDEKISLGGWIYDQCPEALMKNKDEFADRVKEQLKRQKARKDVQNILYALDNDQLRDVYKMAYPKGPKW